MEQKIYTFSGFIDPPPMEPIRDSTPDDEVVEYHGWKRPPGITGDIADFIYRQTPSPLFEVAIPAALAFLAGIVGRAYNVDDLGLNLYVVVLAPTASGKQAAKTGIDKLNNGLQLKLRDTLFTPRQGPNEITSAQGLLKFLAGAGTNECRQCCLSTFGEFGSRLSLITDKRADANNRNINRVMLDLYSQSGNVNRAGGYSYSDIAKNVPEIIAPCWSFIGDSTQGTFFNAVNESSVSDGLMGRFTIFEYKGPLPAINDAHKKARPSEELLDRIAHLLRIATEIENKADNNGEYNWTNVTFDVQADTAYKQTFREIRNQQQIHNDANEEHLSGLIGRSVEKMMKIAAILAIGVNPYNPIITMNEFEYARSIIERSNQVLIRKFKSGDVGETSNGYKQRETVRRFLYNYATQPWTPKLEKSYRITAEEQRLKVIKKSYIQQCLIQRSAFAQERNDAGIALTRAIDHFVEIEAIREDAYKNEFRKSRGAKAYQIVDVGKLRSP